MPPEYRDPTDPAEWLRRARSNVARARADRGLPDVLYEDLCFDAQQAVEKCLKALLVQRKVPFPKTHAIADLLTLVQPSGLDVPADIRQASELTEYAVEARYPGLFEDVMHEDYVQALDLAERVLRWVESLVSPPKSGPRH
ncbi:MAG: HEPN domain-containing protein [candidate division NC10 bacterium]|nr:HEPN domain-containing protein [candidate division NC10 bacterium]